MWQISYPPANSASLGSFIHWSNPKEKNLPTIRVIQKKIQFHHLWTQDSLVMNYCINSKMCATYAKLASANLERSAKKITQNFAKNSFPRGPQKLNPKACDWKCNNLGPIACRDSIKNRECGREKCRFYHLKGTKALVRLPKLSQLLQF